MQADAIDDRDGNEREKVRAAGQPKATHHATGSLGDAEGVGAATDTVTPWGGDTPLDTTSNTP